MNGLQIGHRTTRRAFLGELGFAATAVTIGPGLTSAAAEPPPETTRLRLVKENSICLAPQYVAEEMLKAEGFASVEYVPLAGGAGNPQLVASGKADLSADAAPVWIPVMEESGTVVVLAGVHIGCYELFGTHRVKSVRDLKGKTVAVTELRDDRHAFVASMAMQVGLDPRKDIKWVAHPAEDSMRLLADGKIDAFLAFPPEPQALRAKKIGHVIVDIGKDKPWSQYFCCMLAANREFARRHPVATRRALRAILKANSVCATEPERVARFLVDKGYADTYDGALQTLREIPYARWREYSPEDTMRFYALRLQEAGFIKSSPKKILAQGTDWRFLNELKKELKG